MVVRIMPDIAAMELETDHAEPAIETNVDEFEKVVRSRRSVRVYTDDPVPDEVMTRCLELALLAPNSSNLQAWEFYRVRDPQKKSLLKKFCLDQPAATTAQELVVCVARLDTWDRNRKMMIDLFDANSEGIPVSVVDYYKTLVPMAYGHGPFYFLAPLKRLLMNMMAIRKPMPRKPSSKSDMRVWAHKTTALACENLMLALRAYGYDSCPMEGIDEPRIKHLLGLPRGAEVCMVISAGKRAAGGVYGPQIRFDKSNFVFDV